MAETGCPQTAVERASKRTIQQHFVSSFLATNQDQDESGQQDSLASVDSSVESGIFYLNPLTPKWNCGIAEKSLEISSEEDEEMWVHYKNYEQKYAEKGRFPNRLRTRNKNNVNDISTISSDGIWVQNPNVKGRKADRRPSKQQMISKLRCQKIKEDHLNEQSNENSGIMRNCREISTSLSNENDIWLRSKDNTEDKLTQSPKEENIVKDHFIHLQTTQCTDENSAILTKCAQNTSTESEEKDCVDSEKLAKISKERKMVENDTQVVSKLKNLNVKGENGAEVAVETACKDDAKISRLLEAMKKRGEIDSEQRPFKCPHCPWAFKKLCYLQSHLTTHSGLKPHVCDICGKAYSHQGTLQQHKRLHTGERPYHCPFCDRSYIWSSDYRKHIRTHTGEKPYECKECGKDFIRSSDLRKHERNMHTNNKPFQCSHCDKTFNRPLSLKRHERKHLGERPYSCADCGKKFALESRMAEHQKIHKGVRPYVCSVCAKCFTKSSNLTEHEAIHSGIRPHKCEECGVAFAMASRLVRHQYIHNIGKIHSCGGCSRNFSCLANLEQHQQLNCGGRIFVCVQCDKSFTCADKLAQHMQHHSDDIGPK